MSIIGAVDPFKMDCVSMSKQVKENPYNHLEKHIPLTTRTPCGFETTFKRSLCSMNRFK